jgi:hypothetical protein
MSYLRGPLTRQQIKTLMVGRKTKDEGRKAGGADAPGVVADQRGAATVVAKPPAGLVAQPPVLPPAIKQVYLPLALTEGQSLRKVADKVGGNVAPTGKRLVYAPALIGFAGVRFVDRKLDLDESQDITLLLPFGEAGKVISWKNAQPVKLDPRDLADQAESDAFFVPDLPDAVTNAKTFTALAGDLADQLYRGQSYSLAYNPALKLYGRPGESQRDFKIRCQQAAREQRDAVVDKLRDKYQAQLERLQDKLAREQQDLAENEAQLKGRIGEEVLSGLATVAGALGVLGRRRNPLGGLATAASRRRITSQAQANIAESKADIARLQAQVEQLKNDMQQDTDQVTQQWTAATEDVQQVKVAPRKTDIDVQLVALAWTPTWEVTYEDARGRSRTETIPAYQVEEV